MAHQASWSYLGVNGKSSFVFECRSCEIRGYSSNVNQPPPAAVHPEP
jgi:hypothetical protein